MVVAETILADLVMTELILADIVLIVASSVGAVLIGLLVQQGLFRRRQSQARPEMVPAPEPTVFLFDGTMLLDATGPARALLEAAPGGAGTAGNRASGGARDLSDDWTRLRAFICPRFPEFERRIAGLPDVPRFEIESREDPAAPLRLIAEDVRGLTRLTLIDPAAEGCGLMVDALSHRAFEEELDMMRRTLDQLPALAWREAGDGQVTWANRAYLQAARRAQEPAQDGGAHAGQTQDDPEAEGLHWPLPRLFAEADAQNRASPGTGTGTGTGTHVQAAPSAGQAPPDTASDTPPGVPRRARLTGPQGEIGWFDRFSYPLEKGVLHIALPADAAARAEQSLQRFVQTLTKTFADLPIGLAVFDRQRKLQLFNPALIELTLLPGAFLTGRPTLHAFLDRLREARMVPEPKDFRSWRRQMGQLEQAAAAGFHSETWSLPGGQIYRVTGRPHPDGAVAFLFEDITSEITLTRRFRAELELGQEVIDQLPDAIAVFRATGDLALSNAAYDRLWGVEPASTLGRVTIADALRLWMRDCAPDPVFGLLRHACGQTGTGPRAQTVLTHRDGRQIALQLIGLAGGAVLVRCTQTEPQPLPQQATPGPSADAAFAGLG